MGKWTLDYHDDVLRNKLKNLVAGAVNRAEREKGEPTITYEAFVEELDEGDAFTYGLIDVLVQEMAERRTRPNPIDRRYFISERTAKSLGSFQSSIQVYQNRPRRRFNVEGFPAPMPSYSDSDDDFAQLGGSTVPEGVRINSELHDAYDADSQNNEDQRQADQDGLVTRLMSDLPPPLPPMDPTDRDRVTSPRPQSPPFSGFRNSFWGNAPSGTFLTRANSMRRHSRSRTNDFNDFTFRRRFATRQHSLQEGDSSRHDEPADGLWQFGPAPTTRGRQEDGSGSFSGGSTATLPQARRFFPLSAWTSARRRNAAGVDIWGPDPGPPSPLASTSSSAPTPTAPQEPSASTSTAARQSSSQLWYTLTSGHGSPGVSSSTDSRGDIGGDSVPAERRQVIAPRLRRGGLRAPESLISQYTSPSTESLNATAQPASTFDREATPRASGSGAPSGGHMSGHVVVDTSLSLTTSGTWEAGEESQQLLTPRSVSPVGDMHDHL